LTPPRKRGLKKESKGLKKEGTVRNLGPKKNGMKDKDGITKSSNSRGKRRG